MIDEYEDPWGAHQGVPKVQKWQKLVSGRAIVGPCLTILGYSGPLDKNPQVVILRYHSLLLFLHQISFIKMQICLPKVSGRSKKKPKDVLVNFGHSGPFRTPEWIPPGVHIIFYHSVLLHPHKISVKIVQICYLSELDGSKIKRVQDM